MGGATGYLDRMLLGEKHIFQHPTAREIYGSGPFDPEGIVGKMSVVEELGGLVDINRSLMDLCSETHGPFCLLLHYTTFYFSL